MEFTTEQIIVLVVLFIAGLLIGLAVQPGGAKLKRRIAEEETKRKAAEERAADAERALSEMRRRTPLGADEFGGSRDGKPVYISPEKA